jgi:hypothetical protein
MKIIIVRATDYEKSDIESKCFTANRLKWWLRQSESMSNLTGLDGKTQRHFGSLAGREREVKGHEWNDVYDRPESCWERFRVSTG